MSRIRSANGQMACESELYHSNINGQPNLLTPVSAMQARILSD